MSLTDPDATDGKQAPEVALVGQSVVTGSVLDVIPDEGPMKEEVDCAHESIQADNATQVSSTGNTTEIHAKEESTTEGTSCVYTSRSELNNKCSSAEGVQCETR